MVGVEFRLQGFNLSLNTLDGLLELCSHVGGVLRHVLLGIVELGLHGVQLFAQLGVGSLIGSLLGLLSLVCLLGLGGVGGQLGNGGLDGIGVDGALGGQSHSLLVGVELRLQGVNLSLDVLDGLLKLCSHVGGVLRHVLLGGVELGLYGTQLFAQLGVGGIAGSLTLVIRLLGSGSLSRQFGHGLLSGCLCSSDGSVVLELLGVCDGVVKDGDGVVQCVHGRLHRGVLCHLGSHSFLGGSGVGLHLGLCSQCGLLGGSLGSGSLVGSLLVGIRLLGGLNHGLGSLDGLLGSLQCGGHCVLVVRGHFALGNLGLGGSHSGVGLGDGFLGIADGFLHVLVVVCLGLGAHFQCLSGSLQIAQLGLSGSLGSGLLVGSLLVGVCLLGCFNGLLGSLDGFLCGSHGSSQCFLILCGEFSLGNLLCDGLHGGVGLGDGFLCVADGLLHALVIVCLGFGAHGQRLGSLLQLSELGLSGSLGSGLLVGSLLVGVCLLGCFNGLLGSLDGFLCGSHGSSQCFLILCGEFSLGNLLCDGLHGGVGLGDGFLCVADSLLHALVVVCLGLGAHLECLDGLLQVGLLGIGRSERGSLHGCINLGADGVGGFLHVSRNERGILVLGLHLGLQCRDLLLERFGILGAHRGFHLVILCLQLRQDGVGLGLCLGIVCLDGNRDVVQRLLREAHRGADTRKPDDGLARERGRGCQVQGEEDTLLARDGVHEVGIHHALVVAGVGQTSVDHLSSPARGQHHVGLEALDVESGVLHVDVHSARLPGADDGLCLREGHDGLACLCSAVGVDCQRDVGEHFVTHAFACCGVDVFQTDFGRARGEVGRCHQVEGEQHAFLARDGILFVTGIEDAVVLAGILQASVGHGGLPSGGQLQVGLEAVNRAALVGHVHCHAVRAARVHGDGGLGKGHGDVIQLCHRGVRHCQVPVGGLEVGLRLVQQVGVVQFDARRHGQVLAGFHLDIKERALARRNRIIDGGERKLSVGGIAHCGEAHGARGVHRYVHHRLARHQFLGLEGQTRG